MTPDPPKPEEDLIDPLRQGQGQEENQIDWIANFEQVEEEPDYDDDEDGFPDDDSIIGDDESCDGVSIVSNSEYIGDLTYAAIVLEEMDNEMPSPRLSPTTQSETDSSSSDEESESEQVVEEMKDNENPEITSGSNRSNNPHGPAGDNEDDVIQYGLAHYRMLIPFPISTTEEAEDSVPEISSSETSSTLTVKIKPVEVVNHQDVVDDSTQNEIIKNLMSKIPAPDPPLWAKNLDDKEFSNVVDHIRKTRKTSTSSSSSTSSQPKISNNKNYKMESK